MARDPLCTVAHLAPGLSQVGLDAGDVGGEGAHVASHGGHEGIHASTISIITRADRKSQVRQ